MKGIIRQRDVSHCACRNTSGRHDTHCAQDYFGAMLLHDGMLPGYLVGVEKVVRVGWSDSGEVYLPNPSGRVFSKKKLVTFPEGCAYTEGSYTLPEERRKGYTDACDSFHLLALAGLGFHKVITTIACKNEPMLRGAKKTGHRRIKKVNYWRILGIRFRKVEDVTETD